MLKLDSRLARRVLVNSKRGASIQSYQGLTAVVLRVNTPLRIVALDPPDSIFHTPGKCYEGLQESFLLAKTWSDLNMRRKW